MMYMPSVFDDFAAWRRPRKVEQQLMRTDVKEKEDGFELAIDLPGFNKEDLKAELKDGYLVIEASRNESKDDQDENGNFIRRERFYGSCSRSFYVGEELKQEDIKAKFENGTLVLEVPKKEPEKVEEEHKYISIAG